MGVATLTKSFVAGFAILIVAIFVNTLTQKLHLQTWYTFLQTIGEIGFLTTFTSTSIPSLFFLFLVYPLLLGAVAYVVFQLC